MSCCGQNRMNAKTEPPRSGVSAAPRVVRIVYLGDTSIRVRGSSSGRTYRFSARRRVQLVEVSDSRALLRTPYFRRA